MRYAFYGHGGCQNHGCEAIVKTLSALIKNKQPDAFIKLYTFNKAEDVIADLPDIDEIEEFNYTIPPTKLSLADKAKIAIYSRQSPKKADNYYYSLSCKNPSFRENDVYISVGGDNYCYGDGHFSLAIDRELRRLGKKTVLWGCSIDDKCLTEDKLEDLKQFDLIVARETITYKSLMEHGIDKNTVLYPDSAFTLNVNDDMEKKFPVAPHTIGLNISDLINDYAGNGKNIAKTAAIGLISHILNDTDMNIVLIPHVTRKHRSDVVFLENILSEFNSDRITMVDGTHSASEYKSVISRCEMFIGARTHATIAAYSTCVPTLVIGYSVKSIGIATDIFGTDKGLVLPVWEIEDNNRLTEEFKLFISNKKIYKARLEKVMPEYTDRARFSINELFKV